MAESLDRPSLIDAAWGTEEATPPATEADPAQALATARALFEEGRLEDAWELAELAREGLGADPAGETEALHLLALIARERGFLRVGEERIARAIAVRAELGEGAVPLAWYELHAALALANGEHTTAVSAWELAAKVARSVRDATGDGTERLCIALRALGDAHLARGDLARAREALGALVIEARALRHEGGPGSGVEGHPPVSDPTDTRSFRHLTSALQRLGDACHADHDLPAAISAYRDAVREAKRAAAASNDSSEALWDVSVGLNRLGAVQLEADQAQAAIASFEASVDARRTLCEREGRTPHAVSSLASSLSKLAAALAHDGDEAGATAAADEAAALDREAAIGEDHHALTIVPPPIAR